MEGKVAVTVVTRTEVGDARDELHFEGQGVLSGTHLRYRARCTDSAEGETVSAGVRWEAEKRRMVLEGQLMDTPLSPEGPTQMPLPGLTAVTEKLCWEAEKGAIEARYTLLQGTVPVTRVHVCISLRKIK